MKMMRELARNSCRGTDVTVGGEEGLLEVYENQENPKSLKMCLNMSKLSYKHAGTTGGTMRYPFG